MNKIYNKSINKPNPMQFDYTSSLSFIKNLFSKFELAINQERENIMPRQNKSK